MGTKTSFLKAVMCSTALLTLTACNKDKEEAQKLRSEADIVRSEGESKLSEASKKLAEANRISGLNAQRASTLQAQEQLCAAERLDAQNLRIAYTSKLSAIEQREAVCLTREQQLEILGQKIEAAEQLIRNNLADVKDVNGLFSSLTSNDGLAPFMVIAFTDRLINNRLRKDAVQALETTIQTHNKSENKSVAFSWTSNIDHVNKDVEKVPLRAIVEMNNEGIEALTNLANDKNIQMQIVPIESIVSDVEIKLFNINGDVRKFTVGQEKYESLRSFGTEIAKTMEDVNAMDLTVLSNYLLGSDYKTVGSSPVLDKDQVAQIVSSPLMQQFYHPYGRIHSILASELSKYEAELLAITQSKKRIGKGQDSDLMSHFTISGRMWVKVKSGLRRGIPFDSRYIASDVDVRDLTSRDDEKFIHLADSGVFYLIPNVMFFDRTRNENGINNLQRLEYFKGLVDALNP